MLIGKFPDQVNNGGHTMYGCIADLMEAYPSNYTGYLSFHFDLFVNYWNLYGLDKNKTWITKTKDNEGPHSLAKYPKSNPCEYYNTWYDNMLTLI